MLPWTTFSESLNSINFQYWLCFRLCVVLLTKNIPEHDPYRETFRKYAIRHQDPNDRVKYTYIYEDTQGHFVDSITQGTGINNETNLKVRHLKV